MVSSTCLPIYLYDSSDSNDSFDSFDIFDSCDSSDISDGSDMCDICDSSDSRDKTQKLKLWQKLQTQIVTKLKNTNCYYYVNSIVTSYSTCQKKEMMHVG